MSSDSTTLDISVLPMAGQKEVVDFYEKLLVKYNLKKSCENNFLNELLPKKLEISTME